MNLVRTADGWTVAPSNWLIVAVGLYLLGGIAWSASWIVAVGALMGAARVLTNVSGYASANKKEDA